MRRLFGIEHGLALHMAGVGVLLAVAFLTLAGAAAAQTPTTICVPEASSKPLLSTNTQGECPAQFEKKTEVKYKSVQLPGTGDLETLNKLLPHLKFEEEGVGGKPTIQVTGANLQIVSGSGKTNGPVNGTGNVIIGYADEADCMEIEFCGTPQVHTGSHNLVLGTSQSYTSWGAILGGLGNFATAPNTFVVGAENHVTAKGASVSGGLENKASAAEASVGGGTLNKARAFRSSVSGGFFNEASGLHAWVGGGEQNKAGNGGASIVGGTSNKATGVDSAILGGFENIASGEGSSVVGGRENRPSGEDSAILGGFENKATEILSSVSGGEANTASGRASSILGGKGNVVETEWGHFP
jgi:hypothetical protein